MQVFKTLVSNFTNLIVYIASTDSKSQLTWLKQRTNVKQSVFDWIPVEPNDTVGYEECIEVSSQFHFKGRINDVRCVIELRVLCEKDLL
ncbi:collectin-10 [Biomphalaria glabrata]|nr:collectin-10 [Biomphalaria glabrata]